MRALIKSEIKKTHSEKIGRVSLYVQGTIDDLLLDAIHAHNTGDLQKAVEIHTNNELGSTLNVSNLINSERIAYVNKYLYNHFERPDSLMTAPSWKKIDSNIMGYERLHKYMRESYNEQLADWVYGRAVFAFLSTLSIYGGKNMYNDYITKYYSKEIHDILKTFPDKKIAFLDKILKISPSLFYVINRALRKPNSVVWNVLSKKLHNK